MSDLSAFLTLPGSKEPPMKGLTHKLRLLALRDLMTHPPIDGFPGKELALVQRSLPWMVKTNSNQLLAAIGMPEILTPLLVLRAGLGDARTLMAEMLPHLIASLSMEPPFLWDHPVHQILSPLHVTRFDPPARAFISDKDGVEVEDHEGKRRPLSNMTLTGHSQPRSWPIFSVGQSGRATLNHRISLAAVDTNPLRMQEAHPDKSGNALSLGEKTVEEWQEGLNEALSLIQLTLPSFYAALPHTLRQIVPVGFEPEMHLSASYREAPGTIYMTLHPSPLTLAEAIVHEVQHGKLNTLSWFDPVLHNAMSEWTESPVRPDLRPIWGVLLAVHAFVPVALMHQRLEESNHWASRTPLFKRRRVEVLQGNQNGLDLVLEKAKPTKIGARVVQGLEKLHAHCMDKSSHMDLSSKDLILPPG